MGKLVRGITKEKNARFFCVDAKNVVQQAREIHETSVTATAAFGRLLIAALMMGRDLKDDNGLATIKLNVDGPVGKIIVTANNKGQVKGDIYNPGIEMPLNKQGKLDVAGLIGKGNLTVIKDIGLKHPYSGVSPIISGELGEDIAYYYFNSEQIASVVGLGVLVKPADRSVISAGGFIIQLLPDAKEEFISKLEEKIKNISSVTEMLGNGMNPEEIVREIFDGVEDIEINDSIDTQYYCNCDKERFFKALITLGDKELKELFEKEDTVSTECHFCKKKYTFKKDEFEEYL